MDDKLETVLADIDAANSNDPSMHHDADGNPVPGALLYGQRMSAELQRLFGDDVSDILKIAARGQHIERWKVARTDYPEGRTGYLTWRRDQARTHGERLRGLMDKAGYTSEECDRVGVLLSKEGLKRDPEVQMLEDTICMVFLKFYYAGFSEKHPFDKVVDIVTKTARKLSQDGRDRVLKEFDLPEDLQKAIRAVS